MCITGFDVQPHWLGNQWLQAIAHTSNRQQQELQGLQVLQRRADGSFLNQYDQLFRYVSLFLLHQGYDVSVQKPHQSLRVVCQQLAPQAGEAEIASMIQMRHHLKHGRRFKADAATEHTLTLCLQAVRHCYQQLTHTPIY